MVIILFTKKVGRKAWSRVEASKKSLVLKFDKTLINYIQLYITEECFEKGSEKFVVNGKKKNRQKS